jgi:hypothetical protein
MISKFSFLQFETLSNIRPIMWHLGRTITNRTEVHNKKRPRVNCGKSYSEVFSNDWPRDDGVNSLHMESAVTTLFGKFFSPT